MNLEVVREFIKAFEGLGGEAKEGFIWYLCFFYISNLISTVIYAGCVIFAITKIYNIFNIFSVSNRLHKVCYGHTDDWRLDQVEEVSFFLEKNFRKQEN